MKVSNVVLNQTTSFPSMYQHESGLVVLFTKMNTGFVLVATELSDAVGTRSDEWSLDTCPREWTRVRSITLTDE